MKTKLYRLVPAIAALGLLASVAYADDFLPREKVVLQSTMRVNLTNRTARLPLYKGFYGNTPVWFVLTDVSDEALAKRLGLNFAPKLANAPRGCPGCVQVVNAPADITTTTHLRFNGIPDFSPSRRIVPGPTGSPLLSATPGAVAGPFYTPYIQPAGTNIVYNAPIVAVGGGFLDVFTHRNTHDRLINANTRDRWADILFIEAFSGGKEVIYLSFDSSSPEAAALERSTFTPVLGDLAFPNGAFRPDSARAALFAFANGRTGSSSPPAQGLNHLVIDGRITEEAHPLSFRVFEALRRDGDARNVLDVFPTMAEPFRREYSPAWDLHLSVWTKGAIAQGLNVAQSDSNVIRTLAEDGFITSPGGLPLRSANIEVNCPVVAFVNDPPLQPVVPSPFPLPLPFNPDYGGG